MASDRKEILLRATYELLKQQRESSEVLDSMAQIVHYDGADCDGHCLLEDIADELGIDDLA